MRYSLLLFLLHFPLSPFFATVTCIFLLTSLLYVFTYESEIFSADVKTRLAYVSTD
jgi:Na+/H+ antiporter NhaD/arsenite permease-like protein